MIWNPFRLPRKSAKEHERADAALEQATQRFDQIKGNAPDIMKLAEQLREANKDDSFTKRLRHSMRRAQ